MSHIVFIDANEGGIETMRFAKALGHTITFVKSSDFSFFKDTEATRRVIGELQHVLEVPVTSEPEAIVAALEPHLRGHPADAGIASFEGAIEAAAVAFDRLGIAFTPAAAVLRARRKDQARAVLDAEGIANARYRWAGTVEAACEAADRYGYPVILKPPSGMDSMQVSRVDDREALIESAQSILACGSQKPRQLRDQFDRGILIEEMLVGKMVSVEIGVSGASVYRFMCSGRHNTEIDQCLPIGVTMPADITPSQEEACYRYAEAVCRALGLTLGIFHIELMLTDRGPVLVEANPRLMGGVMPKVYEITTGARVESFLLDIHLGKEIRGPLPAPNRVSMVRRLIARQDATIREDLDEGAIAELQRRTAQFVRYNVTPGTDVRRLDLLGRLIVTGDTHAKAYDTAEAMLDAFETLLGVPLVRTEPLHPARP